MGSFFSLSRLFKLQSKCWSHTLTMTAKKKNKIQYVQLLLAWSNLQNKTFIWSFSEFKIYFRDNAKNIVEIRSWLVPIWMVFLLTFSILDLQNKENQLKIVLLLIFKCIKTFNCEQYRCMVYILRYLCTCLYYFWPSQTVNSGTRTIIIAWVKWLETRSNSLEMVKDLSFNRTNNIGSHNAIRILNFVMYFL